MKNPFTTRTIDMKHVPPKIPASSTVMWLTAAHYWQIPQWGWAIVFAVAAIAWLNWLTWFAFHEAIDFDVRVIESVIQDRSRPRTEVAQWAKHLKDR